MDLSQLGQAIVVLVGLTTIITALAGALWKWAKAVEDRAYEKARSEALLREANATIGQKDSELSTKAEVIDGLTTRLEHEETYEKPRLHRQIDELQETITNLQQTLDWIVGAEEDIAT